MPNIKTTITSFKSGVVSPEIQSSIELDIYRSSLNRCENMITTPLGGVMNRPGTQFIRACKDATFQSRLIDFEFNKEQAYVLEFGETKMRVIKDGAYVGAPYELTHNINSADIQTFTTTQSADTLYVLSQNKMPIKITRTADDAWTSTTLDRRDGPWKARTTANQDVVINVSGTTILSSSPIFGDSALGDHFRIGFPIPGDEAAIHWNWVKIATIVDSSEITFTLQEASRFGYENVKNPDFKEGTLFWSDKSASSNQMTHDYDNQRAILTKTAAGVPKMEQAVTTTPDRWHVLRVTIDAMSGVTETVIINVGTASGLGDIATTTLTAAGVWTPLVRPPGSTVYINFDLTGSTDGDIVEVGEVSLVLKSDRNDHNTTDWRLDAFPDGDNDPPQLGLVHEQRLYLARTNAEPQTVWASRLGDNERFSFTTPLLATDAFSFIPATSKLNGIQWIIFFNGLRLGTAETVYNAAGTSGSVITALDINVQPISGVGSLDLEPIVAGSSLIVSPRGREGVIELTSSFESSSYEPDDLSFRSNHLFEDRRIMRWVYARNPDSVIWCVLDDGTLLGLTYIKKQRIWAWHKHSTPLGVGFVDVVSIPNSDDDNIDEVYFVVNRAEEGETANYYVEQLNVRITSQTAAYELTASGSPYDYKFLDSALTSAAAKVITNATQANPVVITATAHGYSNGDLVVIQNVLGMVELNNNTYKVANKTANTFELTDTNDVDIDGTGFTAYISGGEVRIKKTTIPGLTHLEGKTIYALADGFVEKDLVVSSGSVTLSKAASFVHAGIPYVSEIETNDLEVITDRGPTQASFKKINEATVYFHESRHAEASTSSIKDLADNAGWYPIVFNDESHGADPPPLFTGNSKEVRLSSNSRDQERLLIRQNEPLPIHIRRIVVDVDYSL